VALLLDVLFQMQEIWSQNIMLTKRQNSMARNMEMQAVENYILGITEGNFS